MGRDRGEERRPPGSEATCAERKTRNGQRRRQGGTHDRCVVRSSGLDVGSKRGEHGTKDQRGAPSVVHEPARLESLGEPARVSWQLKQGYCCL